MRSISPGILSTLIGVAVVVFACGGESTGPEATSSDALEAKWTCDDRPDHPQCNGGDDGGGDDGGGDGPISIIFPDDNPDAYEGFGIATTGTGTIDLTGENTADGLNAEGTYSLRYETSDCPEADHPLVAMFNDVELNTGSFSMKLDKDSDGDGVYDFNDRIRVDLNELSNPDDATDDHVYSVWFRGRPNDPDYDPATDVQITESSDATSVKVEDEDIFVRKQRCRNPACKAVEVVEGDRCKLAADYSLKVSK